MTKPRVLLADDHVLVRAGMRSILESEYEIAGEVGDGRELVRSAIELRPDVIVADIAMPNLNGLEAIRQLQSHRRATQVQPDGQAEAPYHGRADPVRHQAGPDSPSLWLPLNDLWHVCSGSRTDLK